MKRLICMTALLAALCAPAQAAEGLTVEEAAQIILDYHGVVTDMEVSGYLTLDAEVMTREAAVTAVVRSFGVYPADEPDYIWADEEEQGEQYRPYIDYARRMGITDGVGGDRFAPGSPVTEWALRAMLERADGIEPVYPMVYSKPLCRLLSADMQQGLSKAPACLLASFYAEGREIRVRSSPIRRDGEIYAGWIWFDGDILLAANRPGKVYRCQEWTTLHEMGHYLAVKTGLMRRSTVPEELAWLISEEGDYCDTGDHEYLAESFAKYILWPEEMAENAPVTYQHIEMCLREIADRLAHGTCAPEQ